MSGPGGTGLVLGCGGTLGMSWSVAVLGELERELGWDAREADLILGTSAGAELACLLGAGVSVTEIRAAQDGSADAQAWLLDHLAADPGAFPPLPRAALTSPALALAALRGRCGALTGFTGLLPVGGGDPSWLAALADRCATAPGGWVEHPAVWLVAADVATGERVAFGSPEAPPATLAQALCASWALPGWLPPVEVEGRRYVDGGVVSPASTDLLAGSGLAELIVLAPMASADAGRPVGALARAERLSRRTMSRRHEAELEAVVASGPRVTRFEPNGRDLAAMGGNFMDARRRRATITAASASARELLARERIDAPDSMLTL